ncbi:MAG TPA: hypothetical protein VLU96_11395 [Gaiellaceae bacterium]|nr:hypothetical protein [Gaiellaceae bacterium]
MSRGAVARGVLAVAGSLALGAAGYALAGTLSVSLGAKGPNPATATVNWGDTVEFRNADAVPHGITSRYPDLRVETIPPGSTYTTTFTSRTSTYGYRQTGPKRYTGQIVVRFSGHVSLSARPTAVARSRALVLKGVASLHGTPVLLELRAGGGAVWTKLKVVTSGQNGRFSTTVRLTRGGRLRASIEAGRIRSALVTVDVKPTISVAAGGGRVRARLVPAAAASKLTLECRLRGRWKHVAARLPGASGAVSFPWRGSSGRTLVRVSVLGRDVAAGFAPQSSRTLALGGSC